MFGNNTEPEQRAVKRLRKKAEEYDKQVKQGCGRAISSSLQDQMVEEMKDRAQRMGTLPKIDAAQDGGAA